MRGSGFTGPALEYLMANETSGPANLANSSSSCGAYPFYPNNLSGLAGDFCATLHPIEENSCIIPAARVSIPPNRG